MNKGDSWRAWVDVNVDRWWNLSPKDRDEVSRIYFQAWDIGFRYEQSKTGGGQGVDSN